MAQLLCISEATKRDCNSVGDVVGKFPDDHIFSPSEIAGFNIVKNSNFSIEDLEEKMNSIPFKEIDEKISLPKFTHTLKNDKAVLIDDFIETKQEVLDAITASK